MTHISFGRRQAELDQADLGLLHTAHAGVGDLLGQNQTVHQLAVINGPSEKQTGQYYSRNHRVKNHL